MTNVTWRSFRYSTEIKMLLSRRLRQVRTLQLQKIVVSNNELCSLEYKGLKQTYILKTELGQVKDVGSIDKIALQS